MFAKQKRPRRPNGLSPSCSTYDSSSRGTCRNRDPGPVELEGGRGRVQAQPAERGQVGAPFPRRGATRIARSQLASSSLSPQHPGGTGRAGGAIWVYFAAARFVSLHWTPPLALALCRPLLVRGLSRDALWRGRPRTSSSSSPLSRLGMAAERPVVHLKIRHRATGLTPPAVATQDLLAQIFVRRGIQPQESGFWANHSQDAFSRRFSRKACCCSPAIQSSKQSSTNKRICYHWKTTGHPSDVQALERRLAGKCLPPKVIRTIEMQRNSA
jgi:hypothetical protein